MFNVDEFIVKLLKNTTGKEMSYKDSFRTSTDFWFSGVTYDGENYRAVIFSEDGVFHMYKKHPLEQNIPSMQVKLTVM
jgi:hypothetical protein